MSSNPSEIVAVVKDDGLIVAPSLQQKDSNSSTDSSIRIPAVDTGLGADFGEDITDDNRYFAATREPIAGFLIYGIANHIVDKWFTINDVTTSSPDPELDRNIQKELRKIKYKKNLQELIEYERLYGKALLVASWSDVAELPDFQKEKSSSAQLTQLAAYPKSSYNVWSKDEDKKSLRYGLPLLYQVNNGSQVFQIHWTRCFELQTRTNGKSVLDLIWDDLTCGRNIRWGVGQWVYRTGGGFAVIKFPKEYSPAPGKPAVLTTPEQLQVWATSAAWRNITHRNYICIINEVMDFKFEGAQGASLNPEPFFDTNTKQIAKATGYPKSILEGAEAGALIGSEKNDQQFYKQISAEQAKLEDLNRWIIDQIILQLNSSGPEADAISKPAGSVFKRFLRNMIQPPAKTAKISNVGKDQEIEYEIVWNDSFQLNAVDEARANLLKEQANQTRLQYKQIDEVRADNNLKPLPLGEGKTVLSLQKTSIPVNSSGNSAGEAVRTVLNSEDQDSAVPQMRELIRPIIKQVFQGQMNHDLAVQQGTALIDFYTNTEKERALEYTRSKLQQPTINLSPEQEQEFLDQKERFLKDFLSILSQAEKLVKAKQNVS